jgi:type VI secretion system protein VasD
VSAEGYCLGRIDASAPRVLMRRPLLLGLGAWLLAGCSGPSKMMAAITGPKPTRVQATLQASEGVNPDQRNRASPVLARVYELASDAAFNNADFMALFQNDQATLGADIVWREEFTLKPAERRAFDREAGEKTRFLAVFAAYRDVERARWRAIIPIQRGVTQQLTVQLDALAVSMAAAR